MRTPKVIVPILFLLAACQTTSPGGTSSRGTGNVITQEELMELENAQTLNAKQAIQRLRPSWLRPRSSGYTARHTARVFRDGMETGDLDTLTGMDVRNIVEIRYLSASDATNRYGTGYPGGVILVTTKSGH